MTSIVCAGGESLPHTSQPRTIVAHPARAPKCLSPRLRFPTPVSGRRRSRRFRRGLRRTTAAVRGGPAAGGGGLSCTASTSATTRTRRQQGRPPLYLLWLLTTAIPTTESLPWVGGRASRPTLALLALALTPAARHVRPTQRARPPQLARRLRSRWRHRRRPLREERRQLEESCHGGAPCGGEGALASSHVLRRIGRRAAAGDASVPQRGAGDGAGRQLCDTEDCELDLWRHARAAHAA